jgi:hypothetical protein
MARKNRNMDRFSGANHFQHKTIPARWMLFTDGKGTHSFFYGPLLHAGSDPELMMKKPNPQPDNIRPLLDEETRVSIRNLLFGPKVLGRLKILARLAGQTKATTTQKKEADDERLAA